VRGHPRSLLTAVPPFAGHSPRRLIMLSVSISEFSRRVRLGLDDHLDGLGGHVLDLGGEALPAPAMPSLGPDVGDAAELAECRATPTTCRTLRRGPSTRS
jgi:hypothetical protein